MDFKDRRLWYVVAAVIVLIIIAYAAEPTVTSLARRSVVGRRVAGRSCRSRAKTVLRARPAPCCGRARTGSRSWGPVVGGRYSVSSCPGSGISTRPRLTSDLNVCGSPVSRSNVPQ